MHIDIFLLEVKSQFDKIISFNWPVCLKTYINRDWLDFLIKIIGYREK